MEASRANLGITNAVTVDALSLRGYVTVTLIARMEMTKLQLKNVGLVLFFLTNKDPILPLPYLVIDALR